jgi:UDP-N-acetyl-D-glucosamine dehydrogenase
VRYFDPYVPELSSFGLTSACDLAEALEDADVAAIVTAHPDVDHEAVMRLLPGSLDFRGVTRHLKRAPASRAG